MFSPYTEDMRTCQPVILFFCLSLLGACASSSLQTPTETIAAYLRSGEDRRFEFLLDQERPPRQALSKQGSVQEVRREALWVRADSPTIKAEYRDGVWRLAAGMIESDAASSPEQALVLFERALAERDLRLFTALVPNVERVHWTKERVEAFWSDALRLKRLRSLSSKLVSQTPRKLSERALSFAHAEGEFILELEQDGWKVRDIRPHHLFLPQPAATSRDVEP